MLEFRRNLFRRWASAALFFGRCIPRSFETEQRLIHMVSRKVWPAAKAHLVGLRKPVVKCVIRRQEAVGTTASDERAVRYSRGVPVNQHHGLYRRRADHLP